MVRCVDSEFAEHGSAQTATRFLRDTSVIIRGHEVDRGLARYQAMDALRFEDDRLRFGVAGVRVVQRLVGEEVHRGHQLGEEVLVGVEDLDLDLDRPPAPVPHRR